MLSLGFSHAHTFLYVLRRVSFVYLFTERKRERKKVAIFQKKADQLVIDVGITLGGRESRIREREECDQ